MKVLKYFDELKRAMEYLAEDPDTVFLGQAVACPGTAMSNTLKGISNDRKVELPVDEDMQMGMTNGLALQGKLPVSIFPRWNFLLLATNQLVNHLDKFGDMSGGGYQPKSIIRTSIGSEHPLHPGHQHIGDYTEPYRSMLHNVEVIRLEEPEEVCPAYEQAHNRTEGKRTNLVEYG